MSIIYKLDAYYYERLIKVDFFRELRYNRGSGVEQPGSSFGS